MKNPFQYGGVVSGDAFCNRKKEVEDLLRAMEMARNYLSTPNAVSVKPPWYDSLLISYQRNNM